MPRLRALVLPALCALFVLLPTLYASHVSQQQQQHAHAQAFESSSQHIVQNLQHSLDDVERLLSEIEALPTSVGRAQLDEFVLDLMKQRPPTALVSVSLAPLIQAENAAAFIASQREAGLSEFSIRPAGLRPLMAPVRISHGPLGRIGEDLGQDMFASPEIQPALSASRDSGKAEMSEVLALRSPRDGLAPGFMIAQPRYTDGGTTAGVIERRANIEGWLLAGVLIHEWVDNAIEGSPAGIWLQIRLQGRDAQGREPLYTSGSSPATGSGKLVRQQEIRLGSRSLLIETRNTPEFLASGEEHALIHLWLAGGGLAAALFLIVLQAGRRSQKLIAEQDGLRESLRDAEERWRFAIEGSGDGVWVWDIADGGIRFSPRCDAILHVDEGQAAHARIHPEDEAAERAAMQACIEGRRPQYLSEHRMQSGKGEWLWIAARGMVTARDSKGKALRMIGSMSDITEHKTTHARIRDMAQHDALTGLPNRSLFFDRVQQSLHMARRVKGTVVLIYLDIDRFQDIARNFGEEASRGLLQELARRLQRAVRESDSVGHLARDEFAILLPTIASEQDVHVVLDKIRPALEADFTLPAGTISLSASFGVALFPAHADSAERLFQSAERAMNQARKSGGNTVCFSLARND